MRNDKIDFVITWVDGNDPKWQNEFKKHINNEDIQYASTQYRNWDNLKYWFRSVEKFTPWVHKIHLVTCGHFPSWLTNKHPKLNLVRHKDFIDNQYLPLFNNHSIEINFHKIKGLADKFVYFNDDMFVLKPTSPYRFFKEGLPRDIAVLTPCANSAESMQHTHLNDLLIINKHFNKRSAVNKHLLKWFYPGYGKGLLNNLFLYPWKHFPGLLIPHQAQPFLKSTFTNLCHIEREILQSTLERKFRNVYMDVGQWLFRHWQLASGNFSPVSMRDTKLINVNQKNYKEAAFYITTQKHRLLCINDNAEVENFNEIQYNTNQAFQSLLPEKSSFEK